LVSACEALGLRLVELDDWNCCGSSSGHAVDPELALGLCARNLGLVPEGRTLLTMCPSCHRNLLSAHKKLRDNPALRKAQERKWGGRIDPDLRIVTFLEILHFLDRLRAMGTAPGMDLFKNLDGLKVAAYTGCMSMYPPKLKRIGLPPDLMDSPLAKIGAEVVKWTHKNRCCGTFLAATKPEIVAPLVDEIIDNAMKAGAECIVTACAMCQLNLEIRCTLENRIPILHFSEMMALVLGAESRDSWFVRHLVDPRPLLREKHLIA
jgi:heterodisulfide reductase subunit B